MELNIIFFAVFPPEAFIMLHQYISSHVFNNWCVQHGDRVLNCLDGSIFVCILYSLGIFHPYSSGPYIDYALQTPLGVFQKNFN